MATRIHFAEINSDDNSVRAFGTAPFLPNFVGGIYSVDVTHLYPDHLPNHGDIFDGATNTFGPPPPPPEPPHRLEGYVGELIIDEIQGTQVVWATEFDGTINKNEINCVAGYTVTVTGRVVDRDGNTVEEIEIPEPGQSGQTVDENEEVKKIRVPFVLDSLRLPIQQVDINGRAIATEQSPSFAIVQIHSGNVTAIWEPDQLRQYQVNEAGINRDLPDYFKIKLEHPLNIFVLPALTVLDAQNR